MHSGTHAGLIQPIDKLLGKCQLLVTAFHIEKNGRSPCLFFCIAKPKSQRGFPYRPWRCQQNFRSIIQLSLKSGEVVGALEEIIVFHR